MVQYISDPITRIIIAHGIAGTGKTLVSSQEAVRLLQEKKIKKIVITRPLKTVDNEEIGFLPGTMQKKLEPWIQPMFDYFKCYYSISEINQLMDQNQLEIAPFGFLRGRTFDDSIVIADEMQNASQIQMKLLLTRIGNNSKIIICGDLSQSDHDPHANGLKDLISRLDNKYDDKYQRYKDGFAVVYFDEKCIKRNEIIAKIVELYE
jgi:phosphate starvation-inducible PhoH-like protein